MPFLLPIEDVFNITGRGTVVTGRVKRGTLHLMDKVERVGIRETAEYFTTGIEMFRKILDEAQAGDNVGVLLRGAQKSDFVRGMVLAKPGSIFAAIIDVQLIAPIAMEKGTQFAIREGGRTVASGTVIEFLDYDIPADNKFLLQIDESYVIIGRGLCVTGTIKKGTLHLNDKVKSAGVQAKNSYYVTGISIINSTATNNNVSEAHTNDKVSILIRGATTEEFSGVKYIISAN